MHGRDSGDPAYFQRWFCALSRCPEQFWWTLKQEREQISGKWSMVWPGMWHFRGRKNSLCTFEVPWLGLALGWCQPKSSIWLVDQMCVLMMIMLIGNTDGLGERTHNPKHEVEGASLDEQPARRYLHVFCRAWGSSAVAERLWSPSLSTAPLRYALPTADKDRQRWCPVGTGKLAGAAVSALAGIQVQGKLVCLPRQPSHLILIAGNEL